MKLRCDELTADPAVRTLCKQFSMQVRYVCYYFVAMYVSRPILIVWFFLSSQNSSWSQFVSAVLLECVHHEKLQALTPYLQLEQVSWLGIV